MCLFTQAGVALRSTVLNHSRRKLQKTRMTGIQDLMQRELVGSMVTERGKIILRNNNIERQGGPVAQSS